MNAAPDILAPAALEQEWARVEALAHCLIAGRQGQGIPESLVADLKRLQDEVTALRAGRSPWHEIHAQDLSAMEWDLLACIIAPEVQPRVGWLFQNLQPGSAQPFASAALLQELLAAQDHEVAELRSALGPGGRLRERRLVAAAEEDPYQPIRPEAYVLDRLLGWRGAAPPPPGATKVPSDAGWQDLVLSSSHERMLREFLAWVRYRVLVVEQWGGKDVGGPIALFSGASGTGKTFAAGVLANDLGWPLYRVDLGLLVSKYIGETEKNLNRLFDAAHGRPMVLQFDEADSLLGKRGEVKEARDRYANMEVSHLLSRIELHRGPCILTTNLRSHLDPAFLRRFQMIIEFPRPDTSARTALWQRLLPPRAPRDPAVDPELLGRAVNLTGGAIRNAALHAAYLAAEGEVPIDLGHIAIAVWRELSKAGRPVARKELGGLADALPESSEIKAEEAAA